MHQNAPVFFSCYIVIWRMYCGSDVQIIKQQLHIYVAFIQTAILTNIYFVTICGSYGGNIKHLKDMLPTLSSFRFSLIMEQIL